MKRYLTFPGFLLLGYVLALVSGNVNRGRPSDPIYTEISCQANARWCVGDYLYGWPFGSHMGYGGDYDTLWPQFLLNILFWTLMAWMFFWGVRTVIAFFKKRK